MLLENVVIALLALAAALLVGTVLSLIFFTVIQYGIGIGGIQWMLDPKPYKITVFLYGAVIVLTFCLNAGGLFREKIGALLKAQYRSEKQGLIYRILCRFHPEYMRKNTAKWAFLRRHSKEWGFRYVFAALIVTCSVILVSVCLQLYPAFLQDAESYSPYDLVYSEIYGMNQVPEENVTEILKRNKVIVRQAIQVPYLRNAGFNFLSAADINRYFSCDYQIEEGQFLNLFQYDLQDGYEYHMQPVSDVTYDGAEKLYSIGSDVRILWNQNPTFADRTLLVSVSDFERLKEDALCQAGVVHLFLFERWENSYGGVCAVNEYLKDVNQVDESEHHYYQASSKIESYSDAEKSGRFLLFLMAFVIALLLTAEFLLIHFRIQAESEENGRVVHSLQSIGMTDQEIVKCLKYKNFIRFIPPLILGTILSFLPSYYLNGMYGAGIEGIFTGAVFGIIVAAAEGVFLDSYSKKERKGMKNSLF